MLNVCRHIRGIKYHNVNNLDTLSFKHTRNSLSTNTYRMEQKLHNRTGRPTVELVANICYDKVHSLQIKDDQSFRPY